MKNFFELYDLPVSFSPDPAIVKKQYYALSKKYHPDFYANQSEEIQEEVLQLSTENTKAYQTFSDKKKLTEYVLQLLGTIKEEEHYNLPQDFLMEMMEVNEKLMDLQFDPNVEELQKVKSIISKLEAGLNDELNLHTNDFDVVDEDHKQVKLSKIKDLYYRSKYLARLNETLTKMG